MAYLDSANMVKLHDLRWVFYPTVHARDALYIVQHPTLLDLSAANVGTMSF